MDPSISGILVQLPMPAHIVEESVLSLVSIEKDVDGFSPGGISDAWLKKAVSPCFFLAHHSGAFTCSNSQGVKINGANPVVLGRSNIVGMPAALLLLRQNATVTICHSPPRDLPGVIRQADILIAAIGKIEMVRGDWLAKPGTAVINVGINEKLDPSKKSGRRLVGDVDFEEAKEVAGWITPVPGWCGSDDDCYADEKHPACSRAAGSLIETSGLRKKAGLRCFKGGLPGTR